MEKVIRQDGAVLAPCEHCGSKPQLIETIGAFYIPLTGISVTYRMQCPNADCGLATDDYEDRADAALEWDLMMTEE